MSSKRMRRSLLSLTVAFAMVISLIPPIQAKAAEKKTGVFITANVWDSDGAYAQSTLHNADLDPYESHSSQGVTFYAEYFDSREEGTMVNADNLRLYPAVVTKWNGDEPEEWTIDEDNLCEDAIEQDETYDYLVSISFPRVGEYALCYVDGNGDTVTDGCALIKIDYPTIGIYDKDDNFLNEFYYDGQSTFFIKIAPDIYADEDIELTWLDADNEESELPTPDRKDIAGNFDAKDKGDGVFEISLKDISRGFCEEVAFKATWVKTGTEEDSGEENCRLWVKYLDRDTGLMLAEDIGRKEATIKVNDEDVPLEGVEVACRKENAPLNPRTELWPYSSDMVFEFYVAEKNADGTEGKAKKASELVLYKITDSGNEKVSDAIKQWTDYYYDEVSETDKEIVSDEIVRVEFSGYGNYLLCTSDVEAENATDKNGILISVALPKMLFYNSIDNLKAGNDLGDRTLPYFSSDTIIYAAISLDEDCPEYSFWYSTDGEDQDVDEDGNPRVDEEGNPVMVSLEIKDEGTTGNMIKVKPIIVAGISQKVFEICVNKDLQEEIEVWFNGCWTDEENVVQSEYFGGMQLYYQETGLVGDVPWRLEGNRWGHKTFETSWDDKNEIGFNIVAEDGTLKNPSDWSLITIGIYKDDNTEPVRTATYNQNNIFTLDTSGLVIGDYTIKAEQGVESLGSMNLYIEPWDECWYIDGPIDNQIDMGWACPYVLESDGITPETMNPLFLEDKDTIADNVATFASNQGLIYLLHKKHELISEISFAYSIEGQDPIMLPTPQPTEIGNYWRYQFSAEDLADAYAACNGSFSIEVTYERKACLDEKGNLDEDVDPSMYNEETQTVTYARNTSMYHLNRKHYKDADYNKSLYYVGNFMTKEEYEYGDWDAFGKLGITDSTYWCYGETLQEVLDKMKAKAEATPEFKYEYVNISSDGCKDNSACSKNQVLDLGNGELKGIRLYMDNNGDSNNPWADLTIKGSLKDNAPVLISGMWEKRPEGAELPKLTLGKDVVAKINYRMDVYPESEGEVVPYKDASLIFPNALTDGLGDIPAEIAEIKGLKIYIYKNSMYNRGESSFIIQYDESEKAEASGSFTSGEDAATVAIEAGQKEDGEDVTKLEDAVDSALKNSDAIKDALEENEDSSVQISLNVDNVDEKTASDEVKEDISKLQEEADKTTKDVPAPNKKLHILDFTLEARVIKADGQIATKDDGTGTQKEVKEEITETDVPIKITIKLPAGMKWKTSNPLAKGILYFVYRCHNGVVTKIPAEEEDGFLGFESDKFSTYAIEAVENIPQSIEVATAPKTTYTEGETFSAAGMVVNAVYLDGTKVDVTSEVTVDKTAALATTDTNVVLTYKELTTDLPITVTKKAEDPKPEDPKPEEPKPEEPKPEQPKPEEPKPEEPKPEEPAPEAPKKGTILPADKAGATYEVSKPGEVKDGKIIGAEVIYKKPSKKAANVKIPATVEVDGTSYKVTSIAAGAFKNDKKITTLTIGDNVKAIGNSAFEGCSKLKSVKFGKNVTTIGKKVFYKCVALKTVTIPNKVTSIGASAFEGCTKLTSVTIGTSLKTIGDKAFSKCSALKKITIKSTKLTKVGSKAINGINKKATIKVPAKKLAAYKKLFSAKTGFKKTMKIKK